MKRKDLDSALKVKEQTTSSWLKANSCEPTTIFPVFFELMHVDKKRVLLR